MFIKRKKNGSSTISVVVAEKTRGHYQELRTIVIAAHDEELKKYEAQGREWMEKEKSRRQPRLDYHQRLRHNT